VPELMPGEKSRGIGVMITAVSLDSERNRLSEDSSASQLQRTPLEFRASPERDRGARSAANAMTLRRANAAPSLAEVSRFVARPPGVKAD